MSHTPERRAVIRGAIEGLAGQDFASAGRALLDALGYRSPKTLDAPSEPSKFLSALEMDPARFEGLERWRAVNFLLQLTGDELPALSRGGDPATGEAFQRGAIDSFVFLALDLDDEPWSRRQLVAIVRAFNRGFAMPAILLFRHGGSATLAVIDRRANLRDPSRDVVGGRISLVKDVDLASPHRAHVEILADLSLSALAARKAPSDFRTLYDLWLDTLSAAELNKRFYEELADWFAWASTRAPVSFPKGQGVIDDPNHPNKDNGAKEIALIRLLTRLMFVWFIKEKRLVPDALFNAGALAKLLKEPPASTPKGHGYYLAVLQNLFFATLNTEMDARRWRHDEGGQSKDYLGHHVFRHAARFAEPAKALEAFESVPFLNGGLFECLDCEVGADDSRKDLAERERGRTILRIDGFSDQPDKQPRLPNALFFGGAKNEDLTTYFGKRRVVDVAGLIDLFERYKFTVEENTPLEEEAALDPELLGKVFENLLASYNEDTRTTARNKSGSFYTPREVVDFMVDEALVAWLLPKLPGELDLKRARAPGLALDRPGELDVSSAEHTPSASARTDDETRLRALLSFASRSHDFSPAQVDALIAAIESCKAIDPAVGSGAFPLGLLQKLVHVLDVLDPGGEKWRARNRLYYERQLAEAETIPAATERAAEIVKARQALADFDAKFESGHYPDYTRKLFLIDRCLHGVDIQPIAVQIAKLRCFISLAVEQKENPDRPNRGITPLPNLEAKFVAANTLTPLHRRGQAGLVTQDLREKQRDLREANRAFFAAANGAAKRAVQKRIKALRGDIAAEVKREHTFAGDDADKLAAWDPFDPNGRASFFDPEWMFGFEPSATSGWFDIALANPPYIRSGNIDPKLKAALKADYPGFFTGSSDILTYFFKITEALLVKGGVLSFITSNNYMRAGYGAATRQLLSQQFQPLIILDFGELPVFKAAVDSTVYIGIDGAGSDRPFKALTIKSIDDISRLGEIVRESPPSMRPNELDPSGWSFAPPEMRAIADRMDKSPDKIGTIVGDKFYRGILTGFNAAFLIDAADRKKLLKNGVSKAFIRPWIDGGEIGRWEHDYSDQYVIAIASGSNIRGGWPWSGRTEAAAERIFAGEHPALFNHLVQWRKELKKRADKGEYWWELRSCAYWDAFKKTKIAYNETSAELHAFVDEDGFCFNKTAFILLPEDPWSLVAIMLSKPLDFYYRMRFPSHGDPFNGGRPQFRKDRMLTVPVPTTTAEQRASLALLAQAVTRSHEAVEPAFAARLEALINAFVYELFFADELHARNLHPFAAAREAGLMKLADYEGPALARAGDEWSRHLADPAHPLYATLFDLQSIDAVRIIEERT